MVRRMSLEEDCIKENASFAFPAVNIPSGKIEYFCNLGEPNCKYANKKYTIYHNDRMCVECKYEVKE